jgi:hypothetical protein
MFGNESEAKSGENKVVMTRMKKFYVHPERPQLQPLCYQNCHDERIEIFISSLVTQVLFVYFVIFFIYLLDVKICKNKF